MPGRRLSAAVCALVAIAALCTLLARVPGAAGGPFYPQVTSDVGYALSVCGPEPHCECTPPSSECDQAWQQKHTEWHHCMETHWLNPTTMAREAACARSVEVRGLGPNGVVLRGGSELALPEDGKAQEGDTVITRPGGRLTLEPCKGGTVTVFGGTRIRLGEIYFGDVLGGELFVDRGRVRASNDGGGYTWIITPVCRVGLFGADAEVATDGLRTTVLVHDGAADIWSPEGRPLTTLETGQEAEFDAQGPVLPEQRPRRRVLSLALYLGAGAIAAALGLGVAYLGLRWRRRRRQKREP